MILQIHSYWAYITIILLLVAFINSFVNYLRDKPIQDRDLRLNLFTLIVAHIQLLIGLAWYFMSPAYKTMKQIGMGATMKDSLIRLHAVEHPIVMILAIVLITVGFSKHKNKKTAKQTFKTIAVYYGIALALVLSRIPWQQWFQ